jgi:hypothetical protein
MLPVTEEKPEDRQLDEHETLVAWRLLSLLDAGYDLESATPLCTAMYIDLHEACDLVGKGCPPELATAILL